MSAATDRHAVQSQGKTSTLENLRSRAIQAIRLHLACVGAAHASRCRNDSVPANIQGDTGFTAEEATGLPSWQPALPFFMQSGFGKHSD